MDGDDIYTKSLNPEIKNIKNLQKNEKIIGVIIETRFSVVEEIENVAQKSRAKKNFILSGALISKPL